MSFFPTLKNLAGVVRKVASATAAAFAAFAAFATTGVAGTIPPVRPAFGDTHTLVYDAPAKWWTDALPVGNGRLGAMVFGGTDRERIQLNEGTVWAGSPYHNNSPDSLAALPKIRELMFAGKHREAQELAYNT
ncbi:MAG: glycoside hydrolase family 95 protein, partial [Puniceicoccales bacterium]|nr:glycoside hydrolase family 95 protein [Puniceicoccales bacterium]